MQISQIGKKGGCGGFSLKKCESRIWLWSLNTPVQNDKLSLPGLWNHPLTCNSIRFFVYLFSSTDSCGIS